MLTVLKVAGIAFIVSASSPPRAADWSHSRAPAGARPGRSGWALFGAAMLAALWAYDGWNNMPMAAGEVSGPGRNVPRALAGAWSS